MGSCTVDRRTENFLAKNVGGCRNIFVHSDYHMGFYPSECFSFGS